MPRDYLAQDRGNPADLLVAGAMAAMFFTPLGGKIMGGTLKGLFRGAMGAGRGAYGFARRTTTGAMSAWKGADRAGMLRSAKRIALGTYGGVTAAARGGAEVADFLGRHRGLIAPMVVGGAAVGGAAAAIGTRSPSGPEAYTSFEDGMPADNLGATGDLTLALHTRR